LLRPAELRHVEIADGAKVNRDVRVAMAGDSIYVRESVFGRED